VVEQIHHLQQQ